MLRQTVDSNINQIVESKDGKREKLSTIMLGKLNVTALQSNLRRIIFARLPQKNYEQKQAYLL